MNAPCVSVVIPLYNKAPYVARCVASIQAQTRTDFEVVVVDDGSTDSSFANFERACQGDPRFRLFRQTNGGVSRARNTAIGHSRAPWLVFLDADDEWKPKFLETMVAATERFPEAVLIGSAYEVLHEGHDLFVRDAPLSHDRLIAAPEFFEVWSKMTGNPLFIGGCAARRDVLQAVGGFEPGMNLGEELLTFIRMLEHGKVAYLPEPLATYHLSNTGSLATSPSVSALHKHALLCDEIGRQVARGRCPRSLHVRWLVIHADHLKRRGMRRELWDLLRGYPGYWTLRQWLAGLSEIAGLRSMFTRWRPLQ